MTTPREPRGSHGPYDRDPYETDGPPGWGRPPAGGWGAEPEPRRGDPGGQHSSEYGGEYGSYASGREYGWAQPEYAPVPAHPRADPSSWNQGPPRRSARPRRPPWIPVAVAVAVVVAFLVLGFGTPGWFVTRVFDPVAVQTGVAKVLTDDYAAEGVADAHCPEGVQVTTGATFTCDATIDGDPVRIPVRVTDDRGGYEVGRPT